MPPRMIEQQNDEIDELPDIIKTLLALVESFRNEINNRDHDTDRTIINYSITLSSIIRIIINDTDIEWYLYESQQLIDDITTILTLYSEIQLEYGYDIQDTCVIEFLYRLGDIFIETTYQKALEYNIIELVNYINENFNHH